MATYSRDERLAAIKRYGFADPLTALAVSLAEFGENRDINTQSQSDYRSGGAQEDSWGPWQIHLPSHPDVSRSCAMDLECSTQVAARLSKGGTDFGPWSAFTNGSFQRFLDELKQSTPSSPAAGDGSSNGSGAGSTTQPVSADPCADVAASTISSIKISMGSMLKVGKDAGYIAESLKALYPSVPVACMQKIAYGTAGAIKSAPDQQAAKAVGDAAGNIAKAAGDAASSAKAVSTFLGDVSRPANLWRAGFLVLGAALIFFGARMYFHVDAASEQTVEGGAA